MVLTGVVFTIGFASGVGAVVEPDFSASVGVAGVGVTAGVVVAAVLDAVAPGMVASGGVAVAGFAGVPVAFGVVGAVALVTFAGVFFSLAPMSPQMSFSVSLGVVVAVGVAPGLGVVASGFADSGAAVA